MNKKKMPPVICNNIGKCRCCLAKGEHDRNIYTDDCIGMFKKYMNLELDTDPRLSQLLCSACHIFIRDVRRFHEMVARNEMHLVRQFTRETLFVNVPAEGSQKTDVKEEMQDVKIETPDILDSMLFDTETVEDIETKNTLELKSEIEIEDFSGMEGFEGRETSLKTEYEDPEYSNVGAVRTDVIISPTMTVGNDGNTKWSRKRKEHDSESDTPISQIKEEKEKVKRQKEKLAQASELTQTHSKQESLKDNNKIRSNIILILKHSTILPFRNNFRTSYKCFYCNKSFVPFLELKQHIESDHVDVSEGAINKELRTLQVLILSADISCIKCRLCDEVFKTVESLTEHLSNTHGKVYYETVRQPSHGILGFDLSNDNLKCHLCDKEFTFFKNLSMHMNEHYGLFVCYVCGKKFMSDHRYKCHIFNHHENKETKCKHCGENFKTEASMAYHIKKEHLKPSIKCPKCPETFPFSQYIKRLNHMANIHGIRKPVFRCDTCGKEYANSGSLAAHKRYTHKRTKEHRCNICGYITVHNTVMKSHMDVHNGVKKYECDFCKKKFAKPYTLKLHLKIHLNDKRFICSLCDAAFIQKNSLKNHLKARHPDSGIDISKL